MKLPDRIETTDVRADDATYTVLVNNRPLRTPKGHPVTLVSWELANALADELISAGDMDLQRVTLYSLYSAQRDFIESRIEGTIAIVLQHLPGDFVFHTAAEAGLASTQLAASAPLLEFLRSIGHEMPISNAVQAIQIPWELKEALREQITIMNPAQLTVVVQALMNLGSVILGIRLAQQAVTVEQAVAAITAAARRAEAHHGNSDELGDPFVAEMRRVVKCLLQYVRLNS